MKYCVIAYECNEHPYTAASSRKYAEKKTNKELKAEMKTESEQYPDEANKKVMNRALQD